MLQPIQPQGVVSAPRNVARRLVATSIDGAPAEHLDVAIHALAQLPDEFTLQIGAPLPSLAPLRMLTEAYGIANRVELSDSLPSAVGATIVHSSRRNAATAPVRPEMGADDVVEVGDSMAEAVHALGPPSEVQASLRVADEQLGGQRIGIVTNLPRHYRIPLLNEMHRRLVSVGASLRVFFTAPGRSDDAHYGQMEFEHVFLKTRTLPLVHANAPIDLERRLRQFKPTLLVSAGFSPMVSPRVARFAGMHGAGFGVWSGEIARRPTAQGSIRRAERRWILRRADFAVAYGHLAAGYLRALAPELPLVYGRNTSVAGTHGPRAGAASLEALTVARAVPLKRIDVAIDAFRLLGDLPCRLTIVGDGSELRTLRARASDLRNVRLLGAVAPERVQDFFAEADLFLFPSQSDVCGLSLVEAMGCGLASVTTAAPGVVADLAVSGQNCTVRDSDDPGTWAEAVRVLVGDVDERRRLGEAAATTVKQRWTLSHAADAMVAGLRLGVLSARRRGGG